MPHTITTEMLAAIGATTITAFGAAIVTAVKAGASLAKRRADNGQKSAKKTPTATPARQLTDSGAYPVVGWERFDAVVARLENIVKADYATSEDLAELKTDMNERFERSEKAGDQRSEQLAGISKSLAHLQGRFEEANK